MAHVTIRNPQPVPMLDFSRQFAILRQEILDSIEAVCTSQHFILGPQVTSFEHAAATACAVPHAIGCASGTDAICCNHSLQLFRFCERHPSLRRHPSAS